MSKRILITAGPTREPIDPVRYISNYSTGTFGYLIAEEARKRGYDVCLVTGPVGLLPPEGVEVVKVETACEMKEAVFSRMQKIDCLVMAAAVADFKPKQKNTQKIKKKETLIIELKKTPDILSELSNENSFLKIGFALETENPVENGKLKLKEKNLDIIIINSNIDNNDPFGEGKKKYVLISREGEVQRFDGIEKRSMAKNIIDKIDILIK